MKILSSYRLGFILFTLLITFIYGDTLYLTALAESEDPAKNYEIVYIILPAETLRDLHGLRINNLFAAVCYDKNIILMPIMIPRKFVVTLDLSNNMFTPLIDLGDGTINKESYLVIPLPLSTSATSNSSENCSWSILAVKYGLRERYLIKLPPGHKVISGNRFIELKTPIDLAIYFDSENKFFIGYVAYDLSVLKVISEALGLETPQEIRESSGFPRGAISAMEQWNSWLNKIFEKLRSLDLDKDIILVREHREVFIYDPVENNIIYESNNKTMAEEIYDRVKIQWPSARIVSAEGVHSLYEFIVKALKKTILSNTTGVNIYVGYSVYNSVLYLRTYSSSPTDSLLGLSLYVIDTDTGEIFWRKSYVYTLSSTPIDILISPNVPFTESKRYNISIFLESLKGSPITIDEATLLIHKIWSKMPINQTSRGYQILSTGIPRAKDFNKCLSSEISEIVDLRTKEHRQGIVVSSKIKSVTIALDLVNGLYLSRRNNISPVLYLDLCIENRGVIDVYDKEILVKINGVEYSRTKIQRIPAQDLVSAKITVPIEINLIQGKGSILTIEHNLPDNTIIYLDALIQYLYAPEAWRETSYGSWVFAIAPWAMISYNNVLSDKLIY
ncbi:MAG: hypothetical protein ACP5I7_06845, partial [Sulfolobales archaeon]